METFINGKLGEIFDDFKFNLKGLSDLCSLQDLNFNKGHLPDYSNPLIQQLYLLKFFPAHLFEYYDIYSNVIEQNHLNNSYHILSIGAGSGVDYYGLDLALKDIGKSAKEYVYYTGVDVIDWRYRHPLNNPDCRFTNEDISNIHPDKLSQVNLIIFPKSIGNLTESAFDDLVNQIKITKWSETKMYVISSINDYQEELEKERYEKLLSVFVLDHGYTDLDEDTDYYYFDDKENTNIFSYPEHIKKFLGALQDQCKSYDPYRKECISLCESLLNNGPLLGAGHIKYQMKRIERR